MTESRREFLRRLARGAAYTAPVVWTLSAPEGMPAQGVTEKDEFAEPPGMEMGMGMGNPDVTGPGFFPSAPWDFPP